MRSLFEMIDVAATAFAGILWILVAGRLFLAVIWFMISMIAAVSGT